MNEFDEMREFICNFAFEVDLIRNISLTVNLL